MRLCRVAGDKCKKSRWILVTTTNLLIEVDSVFQLAAAAQGMPAVVCETA